MKEGGGGGHGRDSYATEVLCFKQKCLFYLSIKSNHYDIKYYRTFSTPLQVIQLFVSV